MANFLYELGATVRDRMTSFEGTVSARTEWFYGCLTYVVQPRDVKDGKPVDSCPCTSLDDAVDLARLLATVFDAARAPAASC